MEEAIQKYPKKTAENFEYGTAGFRDKAEKLDFIVFRMGLLASLRSRVKDAAVGLVITASHNPEPDNGIKLVDPFGEMLEQSWESFATQIVNVSDEKLVEELEKISKIVGGDSSRKALVFIGRDTRPSSPRLAEAAIAGVQACNGQVIDEGVVSTPLLHYLVNAYNTSEDKQFPNKDSYYARLSSSYNALMNDGPKKNYVAEVDFDGSNGVGSLTIKRLAPFLKGVLKINIYNSDIESVGMLNFKCGSDHVKTNQTFPEGFEILPLRKIISVDGDADRVVYSYLDASGQFHLMDGDKIAVLVAEYLIDLISKSKLNLEVGIVQTAYSNGNCTKYITENLKIPVACVLTGVKHLHHKATEYDVGVYFEANGHGTVVFSDKALKLINESAIAKNANKWSLKLKQTVDVINSIVGDAISDMLLVEAILYLKDWTIQDWEAAYSNLPSKLAKVLVRDRSVIKTKDASRICTHPVGLQEKIDSIVSEYENGRSFVRPSGTEDVVRVYAEASTQEMADELASRVSKILSEMANDITSKI